VEVSNYHLLGALTQIEGQLAKLLEDVERARDRGLIDHFETLAWAAGGVTDYDHRGVFAGIAVLNDTANDVFVGLAPGSGIAAQAIWRLRTRSYICLPVRGSVVSVGGAVAGSVLLVTFFAPPTFSAGQTS